MMRNNMEQTFQAETSVTRSRGPCLDQTDKQTLFSRHFGQGNIYDTPDRRGIAVDLLILFSLDTAELPDLGVAGEIVANSELVVVD